MGRSNGLEDGHHKAVIVHEQAAVPHHEVAVLGDGQVINLLCRVRLDRLNCYHAVDHAEAIAGVQLARHGPSFAGLPEAVDSSGDDRFTIDRDPERCRGAIQVRGKDRLERECASRCVLSQGRDRQRPAIQFSASQRSFEPRFLRQNSVVGEVTREARKGPSKIRSRRA